MNIVELTKEIIPYVCFVLFVASCFKSDKSAVSITLSFYFLAHLITGLYNIKSEIGTTAYFNDYISLEVGMYRLEGAFAMIFAILSTTNKIAKWYSLLLCCALFTHSMLIYDLQQESSILSSFVYDYCDELIILIWLLMMAVARDGLITAFIEISLLLRSSYVYCIRGIQNISVRRKGKKAS